MKQMPLITPEKPENKGILATNSDKTAALAAAADQAAQTTVFAEHQAKLANSTLARHKQNLKLFATFLNERGGAVDAAELFAQAEAWHRISFGLVQAFKLHLVNQGYSISTVNLYQNKGLIQQSQKENKIVFTANMK